jgi:hypothetical protein
MSGGQNRGILTVEHVMTYGSHTQAPAPPAPGGEREAGIRGESRGIRDVLTGGRATKEHVGDLRDSSEQGNVPGELDPGLCLSTPGAAGSLELCRTIVSKVDLLSRSVDQEYVGTDGDAAKSVRSSGLIEICGGDTPTLRPLNDDARIGRGDTAAVIRVQCQR